MLYETVKDIKEATYVAFIPKKNHGKPEICPITHDTVPYATFQHKKREYIDGKFVSLKYPVNKRVDFYTENQGLSTSEAERRLKEYGDNVYSIPIPSKWEMLKERITTPFFFFQIFSNLLYIFDVSLSMAGMSIIMIIFTEYNNIKVQMSHYIDTRGTEVLPFPVFVLRSKKWIKISSQHIVPGDVVLMDTLINAPCDLLIMKGRAVTNEAMLTGESTPQLKDPVSSLTADTVLSTDKHKRHIIFSGTAIEQIIPAKDKSLPAEGVLCFALATGFGSAQGNLLRTIVYGERKTSDNTDSFKLLSFLSVFALGAASYYVKNARYVESINSFRIVLEALNIITRTIPVDLPMQLSFQINTQLHALSKLKVSCTEAFRIPYAGMISVCCFDKTGTLTSEEYKFVGVDNLSAPPAPKKAKITGNYFPTNEEMPKEILYVLGGCHSLVRDNYGKLIGDSIEIAGFSAMKFKLNSDKTSQLNDLEIQPIKEYHFSSELRRMSVVCNVTGVSKPIVVIKGAPEAIEQLLTAVPEGYTHAYKNYTKQGCRVLALAYKEYEQNTFDYQTKRDKVEHDFHFVGFGIFSAPLKRGSEDTIVSLLQSKHRCVVITGDDPLTACHVARTLHIINRKPAVHDICITNEDGEEIQSDDGLAPCYTGRCLDRLSPDEFKRAVQRCNVFARMSPSNKCEIISALNDLGEKTLMCGDGTNDVSALKQAHVGVGLLEQAAEEPKPQTGNPLDASASAFTTQIGAASIAAPFVSRRPTISACADIIRAGRATLSSTTDLFKQLSINSLFIGLIWTILDIKNVHFNDRQLFIPSMLIQLVQLSISFAKPRRTLSVERPFPSIFSGYLMMSITLQFLVHLFVFLFILDLVVKSGYKIDKFNPHSMFSPNLLNSCSFLYYYMVQVSTLVVNYKGYPFMQSFSENKVLLLGTIPSLLFIVIVILDKIPILSRFLRLVSFPSATFKIKFFIVIFADLFLSLLFEKISYALYSRVIKTHDDQLVDEEIIESLESYITKDDDILPEDDYDFGISEVLKQNMVMMSQLSQKEKESSIASMQRKNYKEELEKQISTK